MPDGHTTGAERSSYYARIAKKHMAPLWESLHNLVPREPTTRCVPAIWKYDDVRDDVMASGSLITAEPRQEALGDDRLDPEKEQRAQPDGRRGDERVHARPRAKVARERLRSRDAGCLGQGFGAPAPWRVFRNGAKRSMGIGKKVVVFRSDATSRIVWRNRSWTAIGVRASTSAAWASFSAAWASPSALMILEIGRAHV